MVGILITLITLYIIFHVGYFLIAMMLAAYGNSVTAAELKRKRKEQYKRTAPKPLLITRIAIIVLYAIPVMVATSVVVSIIQAIS